MTDTTTTAPAREQQKAWIPSTTDLAVLIDGKTGKQVADFASPHLSEEDSLANFKLGKAAPKLLDALENLVIGIGMGWDVDGMVEVARAAIGEATDVSIGRAERSPTVASVKLT